MFANVFQQLYSVVDTTIVARGVGLIALAALGTIDWLNWMIISVAQGYTQGFSVRISQSFGRGDIAGLKKLSPQQNTDF
jgi:Na+-driven multidrug efflux pump